VLKEEPGILFEKKQS